MMNWLRKPATRKTMTQLQREKVEQEIRNLGKWWATPLLQGLLPATAILVTAGVAAYTGILDVKRERAQIATELAQIEKHKQDSEFGRKETELRALTAGTELLKKHRVAVDTILTLLPLSLFDIDPRTGDIRGLALVDTGKDGQIHRNFFGIDEILQDDFQRFGADWRSFDVFVSGPGSEADMLVPDKANHILEMVATFGKLESLRVVNMIVDQRGAATIGTMSQLSHLELRRTETRDADLIQLAEVVGRESNLKGVSLHELDITSGRWIRGLSRLERLRLIGCTVSKECLSEIASYPKRVSLLSFADSRIPQEFGGLTRRPGLRHLDLRGVSIIGVESPKADEWINELKNTPPGVDVWLYLPLTDASERLKLLQALQGTPNVHTQTPWGYASPAPEPASTPTPSGQ
jgi:hypothetical protein